MLCNDRSGGDSILSLCEQLRMEHLLVANEESALQALNTQVKSELSDLSRLIWICRHERLALHRLVNSDPSVSPDNCNQLMDAINSAEFCEGYKSFSHHTTSISQVYCLLLNSPRAMAEFLNATEKLSLNVPLNELNRALFNVIYGSCVFPSDEKRMLDFLGHMISLQLLSMPAPRRVLRKGNITFSRMYRYFSEELASAKIFLTAALHEPVMYLLSQDELFLDIDPSKSAIRFPTAERERRFGKDENSPSYKQKVAQHRQHIVEKLIVIGNRFLEGIRRAMSFFPPSLTWLVRQLYTSLIERKHVTRDEAALICTDLIFTCFLCSAIINPEPLGIISDTPISYISRFNLIQIGQILQTLALMPYERPPAYMEDVMMRFDQAAMPQVVRTILNADSISLDALFPNVVCDENSVEMYSRRVCAGTLQEINTIHLFLKSVAVDEISDVPLRKSIKTIMKKMPSEFFRFGSDCGQRRSNGDIRGVFATTHQSVTKAGTSPNGVPSRSNSSGKLRNLADKVQNAASKGHQRLMQNANSSTTRSTHPRLIQSLSNNFLAGGNGSDPSSADFSISIEVYFIPLVDHDTPIGLASEESIMQNFSRLYGRKHNTSGSEKRARFVTVAESVVSDRTTNTDAASDEDGDVRRCHNSSSSSSSSNDDEDGALHVNRTTGKMVSSSTVDDENLEDEDEVDEDVSTLPDNFSDGVPMSANVSARGSPSLSGSGCDTPVSSNANDNSSIVPGAAANAPRANSQTLSAIPVTVRKQNSEVLEDKFGKFGLPPQDPFKNRDETYSLVSDSWSTDVVASDNEGFSDSRAETISLINGVSSGGSAGPVTSAAVVGVAQPTDFLLPPISVSNGSPNVNLQAPAIQSSLNVECNEETAYYDPKRLTQCCAFLDAKRKLRLVLCTASNFPSFHPLPVTDASASTPSSSVNAAPVVFLEETRSDIASELNEFLEMLLAESINARDRTRAAQIREVQRCLTVFDSKGIRKLIRTLKVENRKRTSFLLYLQQSKLTLLQLNYHLSRTKSRIQREQLLTAECLIEMLVRFNLEKKDLFLREFIRDFQQLKAQDEKTDAVNKALAILNDGLSTEPMWRYASPENLSYARKCVERALMAHVYFYALYPNGDADHCRDEVFHTSMQRLASTITISHPDLDIPKKFHAECPWPSAQAEIAIINAYKSPRDKVACVVRCCETIENLMALSTSNRAENASADDILPIIVYVLLQANPPTLLSNIQYVNDFYAQMHGKEAYWWTQFTSSVEFIKQLLTKF